MRHLLAPPRVVLHPRTAARVVRGGSASAIVHGLLVLVLALAGRAPMGHPELPRSPRVVLLDALPGSPETPPRREPEAPFRDQRDEHAPDALPLTVRNYVSGDELTIDLARIRQRRNDLFPFVTWDLRALGDRPASVAKGIEWPSAFLPGSSASTLPLSLSPDALQSLIDRAWSRRERWVNLHELVTLTGRYDPDTGDLARVFNGYVTQNVPQPYEDWAFPDPVFWITVTLAADDAPLLQFALDYLKQHPASRVTTELLFLLDDSAATSCDVLGQVLMVGTDELPLDVTKRSNPDAYDLAASLSSAYKSWIRRYNVNAAERCIVARTTILRRIIDTSPDRYGAADARFRLGEMMWRVGRREDAVRWWRGMAPDQRNAYDQARRELLGAIADGSIGNNPQRIDSILANEERRGGFRRAGRPGGFWWVADKV